MDPAEVLDAAAARQGRRRHALLHGRGVAPSAATARNSIACWKWCAASRRSAWKSAARWACSPNRRRARSRKPGLTAYNHNLDTSPEFYGEIITTRVYEDRLRTIAARAQGRHHRLLRRHHGHGRIRRGPHRPAAAARAARSASRKRAHQHAGARRRHAARGCGANSILS